MYTYKARCIDVKLNRIRGKNKSEAKPIQLKLIAFVNGIAESVLSASSVTACNTSLILT